MFTPISVQVNRTNVNNTVPSGRIEFVLNALMKNGDEVVTPSMGIIKFGTTGLANVTLFANDDTGTTPAGPSAAYCVTEYLNGQSAVTYAVIVSHTATITDVAAVVTSGSAVIQLSNAQAVASMVGYTLGTGWTGYFSSAPEVLSYNATNNTITVSANAIASGTTSLVLSGAVDLATLAQYSPAPVFETYIPYVPGGTNGYVLTWDATTSEWISSSPGTAGVETITAADSTITIGGTSSNPTLRVTSGSGVNSFNGRTGVVTPTATDYLAVESGGLSGATSATRFVGGTTAGAPVSGTFAVGDFVVDQTGTMWVCTTAGSPGTWTISSRVNPETLFTGPAGGSSGVCWGQTLPRQLVSNQNSFSATGVPTLSAVYLPAGVTITKLGWKNGGTAAGTPTHQWIGLYDKILNLLANTADQTTAAISSYATYQYVIAATAAGAATSFTTTYSGLHYLGLSVSASTMPTPFGGSNNGPLNSSPTFSFVVSAQAAPPSYPFQATQGSQVAPFYHWAS